MHAEIYTSKLHITVTYPNLLIGAVLCSSIIYSSNRRLHSPYYHKQKQQVIRIVNWYKTRRQLILQELTKLITISLFQVGPFQTLPLKYLSGMKVRGYINYAFYLLTDSQLALVKGVTLCYCCSLFWSPKRLTVLWFQDYFCIHSFRFKVYC